MGSESPSNQISLLSDKLRPSCKKVSFGQHVHTVEINLNTKEVEQLNTEGSVVERDYSSNGTKRSGCYNNLLWCLNIKREVDKLKVVQTIGLETPKNLTLEIVLDEVKFLVDGNFEILRIKNFEELESSYDEYKLFNVNFDINPVGTALKQLTNSKSVITFTYRTADTNFQELLQGKRLDYKLSKKYFGSDKFSDVTICVGDTKLPTHRLVLSEHSPVFERMFGSNLSENQERVVNIVDFDQEVVMEFMEYLYTGSCKTFDSVPNQNAEMAMSLLQISDKYEVTGLKENCAEFLRNVITTENVIKIFHLASLHNSPRLEAEAKEFFTKNKKAILPNHTVLSNLLTDFSTRTFYDLFVS